MKELKILRLIGFLGVCLGNNWGEKEDGDGWDDVLFLLRDGDKDVFILLGVLRKLFVIIGDIGFWVGRWKLWILFYFCYFNIR